MGLFHKGRTEEKGRERMMGIREVSLGGGGGGEGAFDD